MNAGFSRAIIFTKKADSKAKSLSKEVEFFLKANGLGVSVKPQKADLAIVIGGDGTLLGAVRELNNAVGKSKELPLLVGIHTGSLGFLTECTLDGWKAHISKGLKNGFNFETRSMLDLKLQGARLSYTALNDVVVNRSNVARMIEFNVHYNGEFISSTRSDGVIVSTPTGSTAYSLAAGGPIVHPAMPAFLITPICPHTLTNRPIVVSDDGVIDIKVSTPTDDVIITLDGQEAVHCPKGKAISIKKSDRVLRLVRPKEQTYFNTLRNKLSFGKRG